MKAETKENLEPFQQFFDKMNLDLARWIEREASIRDLKEDQYILSLFSANTLLFLEDHFDSEKLMIQVGAHCQAKAKRQIKNDLD